jgi:hypothetical protein
MIYALSYFTIGFGIIFCGWVIDTFTDLFLSKQIELYLDELIDFVSFIHENNPLLINYYENYDNIEVDVVTNVETESVTEAKVTEKYEDKYLAKFKSFPNEYFFNEVELKYENEIFNKLKQDFEEDKLSKINELERQINLIDEIEERGNINITINEYGKKELMKYFDMEDEDDDTPLFYEELIEKIVKEKDELDVQIFNINQLTKTDEDFKCEAREQIINKKLDTYINNYVLEHTPLGNIYMRYNNDKKSFEYFSNSTIPYRYLEPVGRKYVMTYWCKPIFIDIDDELKRAEEQYEKNKNNKANNNMKKNNKSFNPNQNKMNQNKGRNNTLPSQIKVNMPELNKTNEKQLIKENANRYTWEGRLSVFCPLQKIDVKKFDKKLEMSYAEFKKMQQNKKS